MEIVDLPIKIAWWIFPYSYVSHYQRVFHAQKCWVHIFNYGKWWFHGIFSSCLGIYIYISYLGLQLRWNGYHGNFTPMFVGRWGRYNYCDIYPLVNWLIPIEILGNLNLNIALLTLNSRVSNSQINYIDDSIISKWFICSRWYIYIYKKNTSCHRLLIATSDCHLTPEASAVPVLFATLNHTTLDQGRVKEPEQRGF